MCVMLQKEQEQKKEGPACASDQIDAMMSSLRKRELDKSMRLLDENAKRLSLEKFFTCHPMAGVFKYGK